MQVLVSDLETDGLLDSLTRIWVLGIKELDGERRAYADQPGYPSLSEGIERLKAADRIIFHNGMKFDYPVLQKFYGKDVLDRRKIFDTLVVSRLLDPESKKHSLDDWGKEMGNFKGSHNDFSRFSKSMVDYCLQDLEVTEAVYKHVVAKIDGWGYSVELEHEVAYILGLQEINGFGFDVDAAEKLLSELLAEKDDLEKKLQDVFPPMYVSDKETTPKKTMHYKEVLRGDTTEGCTYTKVKLQIFNPGSRIQIANRLKRKYGWKPRKFTPGGAPEVNESIMKELPWEEAQAAAAYLRLGKMVGMLSAPKKPNGKGGGWLTHVRDGRIHGAVNSNGAVTGRMTHFAPNVAQADTDKRMRSLWLPRKGWDLVGCDAEGIELRMLGHYLWRYDGGAFAKSVVEGDKDKGTDAHTINQKIAGLYSRNNAKRLIYAMIYGAGDAKLGRIIIEDAQEAGKSPPKQSPSALGKDVREKLETGIVGLKQLKKVIVAKAKSQGWIKGLDGRKVSIRSTHSALNTLLQSGGAIVMKEALVLHFRQWEDRHV